MTLHEQITTALKDAMKAKDSLRLEALRAVKSALLLEQTSGNSQGELNEAQEIKLLQKLVKQRKESAAIFREQNRVDLAEPEEAQAAVIQSFLPEQLSESEIATVITEIITTLGASGMQDMGKVMRQASKQLAGKADGKTISTLVKQQLSS
ncbi:MAG: GatB/YqeY domain-containing protein [Flavobacteriaceae bacterium]